MTLSPPSGKKSDCILCGSLPQSYLAQTGYGDYLPEAAHKLVSMKLDNRRDVRRCPECGALFDWEDNSQLYGSGNLDEERLDRLSDEQALWVYALVEPNLGGFTPEEVVAKAARELPDGLFHSILGHMCYHSPTYESLVPSLAGLLVASNDQGLVSRLLDWASNKRPRLARVVDLLERAGPPLNQFSRVTLDLARERLAKAPA